MNQLSPEQEETIKISKEQNTPLLCKICETEVSESEYKANEGLCQNCAWLLDK